jgi:uncharacterized protein (DUF433 family)
VHDLTIGKGFANAVESYRGHFRCRPRDLYIGSKPEPRRGQAERTMKASDLISIDPAVMSGTPCFRGTRVPVGVLFENLADGLSLDEILESWPSLRREDVLAVLALASDEIIKSAA